MPIRYPLSNSKHHSLTISTIQSHPRPNRKAYQHHPSSLFIRHSFNRSHPLHRDTENEEVPKIRSHFQEEEEEGEEIGFMGTELLRPHDYLSSKPRRRSDPEKRRRCAGSGGSSRRLFIGSVTILKRGGESLDEKAKAVHEYSGSAFAMSPSPRSLPLPRFCRKDAFVDLSATQGLRRLLRLD